jgi:Mg-chelatase subunit ChlD
MIKDNSATTITSTSAKERDQSLNRSLDTIFVLDCSRSMGDALDDSSKTSKLEISKSALISALSRAAENNCPDRVGLISISTNILAKPIVKEHMKLEEISSGKEGTPKNIPIENIAGIKCQGGTALYSGISYATKLLVTNKNFKHRNQQIVIITDSKNNTAEQPMKVLAEAARNQIRIHVIDLGNKKVQSSLKMISDTTGGQFAFVTKAADLQSNLQTSFTIPAPEDADAKARLNSSRTLIPAIFGEHVNPKITPKRKRAESVEEIRLNIDQIRKELENLSYSLKNGKINQMQFTEKYCIFQFDLQELRQSIREQRSKLNKEMSEYALAQDRFAPDSSLNKEANERLLELDKQIQILKESAQFAS